MKRLEALAAVAGLACVALGQGRAYPVRFYPDLPTHFLNGFELPRSFKSEKAIKNWFAKSPAHYVYTLARGKYEGIDLIEVPFDPFSGVTAFIPAFYAHVHGTWREIAVGRQIDWRNEKKLGLTLEMKPPNVIFLEKDEPVADLSFEGFDAGMRALRK